MFVKIIDRGECFSTTMEFIDGVYANKTEWEKYNFYPQNGKKVNSQFRRLKIH